ncbi:MAG: low molecular weight protein-tyrosine-phosphatase [Spirochaetota bacterium]
MQKIRVLFVCLGNICRSPAAEGTFQQVVDDAGLTNRFEIDSCGTGAYHIGEQPHPTTIQVARQNGIKLDHLKARQFTQQDFRNFDYIFAMDASNLANIIRLAQSEEEKQKIYKFRKFDPDVQGEPDVPDPYFGGAEGFQNVQAIMLRTSQGLLQWMQNKLT